VRIAGAWPHELARYHIERGPRACWTLAVLGEEAESNGPCIDSRRRHEKTTQQVVFTRKRQCRGVTDRLPRMFDRSVFRKQQDFLDLHDASFSGIIARVLQAENTFRACRKPPKRRRVGEHDAFGVEHEHDVTRGEKARRRIAADVSASADRSDHHGVHAANLDRLRRFRPLWIANANLARDNYSLAETLDAAAKM